MAASTWAGVVSAVAAVITAVGGLVTVLSVILPALRKNRAAQAENRKTLDDVHHIVNQQRTDMTNFNRALIRALTDAGVPVPIDQSAEEPPA